MVQHAERRQRRHHHAAIGPLGVDEDHSIGEEALHFTRWFAGSKYKLMASFIGELRRVPEERNLAELQERYCRAVTHGQRVLQARGVVSFLLALGIVATAASAIANLLDVALPTWILERAAAYAASVSVALVALRLLFDRYLERVDITTYFLGMQLTSARP
jgi:hypothetical protein